LQASTSISALSPARHRINSSCHRGRPTPGTGNGVEGSALTRQRVMDAVGWPKSAASDGFLVEFASAVAAVNCAVELQKALAQRNLSTPADRQLEAA
jgi:hypothetical protein